MMAEPFGVYTSTRFNHPGPDVPVGVPDTESTECLVARDHGAVQRATGGVAEEASKDVEEQPTEVGEELPVVTEEHAQDLGYEDARHSFTHAAPGGGSIMGSSHSLALGAKPENIEAMKRCRDRWGVYPIRPERFIAG